jgi:hypothetical protein
MTFKTLLFNGPPKDGPIDLMYMPTRKEFFVTKDVVYSLVADGSVLGTMAVPQGFTTDFASIPWYARWLIDSMGLCTYPALLHDYLYEKRGDLYIKVSNEWRGVADNQEIIRVTFSRESVDAVFLTMLKTYGVRWWKRNLMWIAVSLFGGKQWRD